MLKNIINFKEFDFDPPENLALAGRVRTATEDDGDCLFNSVIQSLDLNLTAKELR